MINTLKLVFSLVIMFAIADCQAQEADRAQEIIDKAIEVHGGDAYDNLSVAFSFRDKAYTIKLDGGSYEYTKSYADTTGNVLDVLNNKGFTRTVNGKELNLSDKDRAKYSNSLNSVCYFTLLPKGLNDPAVKKSMIGLNKIAGQKYHVVQVGFNEEGGGDDHEDLFIYWINQKTYTIDYFAYSYHTNGGGVRFRVAKDQMELGGIRFQNYVNYKHSDATTHLESMPYHYVQGELKKLSEINNESIELLK